MGAIDNTNNRTKQRPPIGRWCFRVGAILLFATLIVATTLGVALHRTSLAIGPAPLHNVAEVSKTVSDRHNKLLRAFTTGDGKWRLPVKYSKVDPKYLKLLYAFEDRRFWQHGGVDPWAILRATGQFVVHRRIVSGASTLTMQVARLIDKKHERTAAGKLRQMARALQLEAKLTKSEILNLYLRLAPFGGNIEGLRAASLAYFGKEPERLSFGQAALLVALPQSPESRRPDRNWKNALKARAHVLDRGVAAGVISKAAAERAKNEPIPRARRQFPKFAAHISETEVATHPDVAQHKLTIDRTTQASLETLAKQHANSLGNKLSVAIVAIDHTNGEVLASVGSAGYLNSKRLGAIDMTKAIRSPGSTLKPLIYGLGFDAGTIHPETLIEDRPTKFGQYAPKNFDNGYRGTITIREALAQSLNIPAVKVLNTFGPSRLVARLRKVKASAVLPKNVEPTLAIGLGGIGFKLIDLARLYAGLARGGEVVRLIHRVEDRDQRYATGRIKDDVSLKLMSPIAASYVTDILKDAPPPANTRRGQIAYKTGTSYGYRDALAIGYDGRHTIAVWVGRADGTSTPGLLGRTAAAPILFDAFSRVSSKRSALMPPPREALMVQGSNLPPPLKRFRPDLQHRSRSGPYVETPVAIAFPPDRSELLADYGDGEDQAPILVRAKGGQLPLTWLVNDAPIESGPHDHHAVWQPKGEGFVRLTVIDATGQVDRVTFRLK